MLKVVMREYIKYNTNVLEFFFKLNYVKMKNE